MKLNIDEYNNYLKQSHREPFELRDGNGFVFISAPHSAGQTRNGRLKYAEPQYAVLSLLDSERLGKVDQLFK